MHFWRVSTPFFLKTLHDKKFSFADLDSTRKRLREITLLFQATEKKLKYASLCNDQHIEHVIQVFLLPFFCNAGLYSDFAKTFLGYPVTCVHNLFPSLCIHTCMLARTHNTHLHMRARAHTHTYVHKRNSIKKMNSRTYFSEK